MVIFPNAKINIGLRITEKRNDGFHNLETLFYPIGLRDALEYIISEPTAVKDEITVTGTDYELAPEDNLVIRALEKLRKEIKLPFLKLHLHKVIPTGAGLGGGSADAARVLVSINRFFNTGLSTEKLKEIAAELGSDCPFFIENKPVIARGRGEIMTPVRLDLNGLHILLLNPGINVSTKDAFLNIVPVKTVNPPEMLISLPVKEWNDVIINDFENTVFKKYPVISEFKNELYRLGAVYSSMSGSGSTVYGIFDKAPIIPSGFDKYVIYSSLITDQ